MLEYQNALLCVFPRLGHDVCLRFLLDGTSNNFLIADPRHSQCATTCDVCQIQKAILHKFKSFVHCLLRRSRIHGSSDGSFLSNVHHDNPNVPIHRKRLLPIYRVGFHVALLAGGVSSQLHLVAKSNQASI